jgi:hypothetical protein
VTTYPSSVRGGVFASGTNSSAAERTKVSISSSYVGTHFTVFLVTEATLRSHPIPKAPDSAAESYHRFGVG